MPKQFELSGPAFIALLVRDVAAQPTSTCTRSASGAIRKSSQERWRS